MRPILISDPTLRDGNHAARHQLSADQIGAYAAAAEAARIPIVEVGHGNGLGASSLQVGESAISDREMLEVARRHLRRSKLSVHVIPGFATIHRDLAGAIDAGVDVFRIASHCTEADITARHISHVRAAGKEVYGVLMMTHMAPPETLRDEALKMESYGAEAIILMDSAGAFLPQDVTERVRQLADHVGIPIGFHAHNNLGLAIANSLAALDAGATILDGTARGFGAGAGNAQLEVLVAVLHKLGHDTGIDLYSVLDAADLAEKQLMKVVPTINSGSVVSGLSGVFSGYGPPVARIAAEFGVDPRDVFFALGERKVVAGQEDLILEVAAELKASGRTAGRRDVSAVA
jgi:4-hydroxy 2-oxovalerate aldolase